MLVDRAAGLLKRYIKWPIEARVGRIADRLKHRRVLQSLPSLAEAIATVDSEWPLPGPTGDRPIMIFAAGWRSGSTLLQRLVMSSGQVIIWGEPYNRCGYVQRLSEALIPLFAEYDLDRNVLGDDIRGEQLSSEFIANLFPNRLELLQAHKSFFETLLAEPAHNRGVTRWGFKEVRLRPSHWRYLRCVFPDARIVIMVRHPYAAFRSYNVFPAWYERWPDKGVFTPTRYGDLWRDVAAGGLEDAADDCVKLVRFEDLVDTGSRAATVDEIESHLDVSVDMSVFGEQVHGRGGTEPEPLAASERRLLRAKVGPVAGRLGYEL